MGNKTIHIIANQTGFDIAVDNLGVIFNLSPFIFVTISI